MQCETLPRHRSLQDSKLNIFTQDPISAGCLTLPPFLQDELGALLAGLFVNSTASVVFFGALHNVRCLTKQVPLLGSAAHKANLVQPRLNIQVSQCRPWHTPVVIWSTSSGASRHCNGGSLGMDETGMQRYTGVSCANAVIECS